MGREVGIFELVLCTSAERITSIINSNILYRNNNNNNNKVNTIMVYNY